MDVKFDPTGFNTKFEKQDKENIKSNNLNINLKNQDNDIILPPHKQPIENIIIDIRNLFFQVLDILENGENPLPFIFVSDKRVFSFSLFLIIFGTLLLLLSSLMV